MLSFRAPQPIPAERGAVPRVRVAQDGRNGGARKQRGQSLVEFALVFPLFIVLLLGIIEFAFMFNATLAVNFASRTASQVAALAGASPWGDCEVLEGLEGDLGPPLDRNLIQYVAIFRTDRAGNPVVPVAQNVWTRSGSTSCVAPNGATFTVPYSLGAGPERTYPSTARCDQLGGCQASPGVFIPLNSIGVRVLYRYEFHTPLRNLVAFLPGATEGYFDVVWSNVMRMEPIL